MLTPHRGDGGPVAAAQNLSDDPVKHPVPGASQRPVGCVPHGFEAGAWGGRHAENTVMGWSTTSTSGNFLFSATMPALSAKMEPAIASTPSAKASSAAMLSASEGIST